MNSSGVIQRFSSTIIRRDQAAPAEADSEIVRSDEQIGKRDRRVATQSGIRTSPAVRATPSHGNAACSETCVDQKLSAIALTW